MDNTLCVIGLGYIGLPTALLFAASGKTVYGVDVMLEKITLLTQGKLPFLEPGLEEIFTKAKELKTFHPTSRVVQADCYIIAVPTPQENYRADLKYVMQALTKIGPFLTDDTMVIIESTIGPSDCEQFILPYLKKYTASVHLAHCPERAIPGNTIKEMQHNARIVGGNSQEDANRVRSLYQSFVKSEIHTTTLMTAAACKVMENTYRDVNIALANEFAKIGDDLGFDVWEAVRLANLHPRVNIHMPGPGVGGHCIAIDPWYFVGESKQAKLIKTARSVNDTMPSYISRCLGRLIRASKLQDVVIGVLGYTYKKNVDDVRETPVEHLILSLEKHFTCLLHDPFATSLKRENVSIDRLLRESNVILLATDHDVFKTINFARFANIKVIYDARNLINKSQVDGKNQILVTVGGGKLP